MSENTIKTKILVVGDLYTIQIDLLSFLLSKEDSKQLEFYITDLSETEIKESELIALYDFVLFYIDMENEHSWAVCKMLLSRLSPMVCLQRCCIILNTRSSPAKYVFSMNSVFKLKTEKNCSLVKFNSDNEDEAIGTIQTVYNIINLSQSSRFGGSTSIGHHSSVLSYIF